MLLLRFFTAYSADTSPNLPKQLLDLGLGTSSALLHTHMHVHSDSSIMRHITQVAVVHVRRTTHADSARADVASSEPWLQQASRCPRSPKVRGGQAQPFAHAMGKRKRDRGDLPLGVQDQVRMGPPRLARAVRREVLVLSYLGPDCERTT